MARQLRKQGQHHDTPRNPDDYTSIHGAAARLCEPGFDPMFSCCLTKNYSWTARYDRLRDPAPSAALTIQGLTFIADSNTDLTSMNEKMYQ